METQEEMLVFIWSEGTLEFFDATDVLQPFTEYEYCVKAQNSKGSVNSSWSSTQTLKTRPSGMKSPSAQAISAHSVFLNWTSPAPSNDPISQYHVVYQERQNDPTINTQDVTALTVPVSTRLTNQCVKHLRIQFKHSEIMCQFWVFSLDFYMYFKTPVYLKISQLFNSVNFRKIIECTYEGKNIILMSKASFLCLKLMYASI